MLVAPQLLQRVVGRSYIGSSNRLPGPAWSSSNVRRTNTIGARPGSALKVRVGYHWCAVVSCLQGDLKRTSAARPSSLLLYCTADDTTAHRWIFCAACIHVRAYQRRISSQAYDTGASGACAPRFARAQGPYAVNTLPVVNVQLGPSPSDPSSPLDLQLEVMTPQCEHKCRHCLHMASEWQAVLAAGKGVVPSIRTPVQVHHGNAENVTERHKHAEGF